MADEDLSTETHEETETNHTEHKHSESHHEHKAHHEAAVHDNATAHGDNHKRSAPIRLVGKITSFPKRLVSRKRVAIPAIILLIAAAAMIIPVTRYMVLSAAVKKHFWVKVIDQKTDRPISGVSVRIGSVTAETDKDGLAKFNDAPLGDQTVTLTKKLYKESSVTKRIELRSVYEPLTFKIEATGRQVPVTIRNKLGNTPLENAVIKLQDSETRTDKDGKAIVVVPAGDETTKVQLSLNDFNGTEVTLKVTENEIPENIFGLTPVGKLYYLSKKSGKIDVVKSNLDGTDRKVVLAGTGKEDQGDTVMLASRDWKYLALKSARDGVAKIFIISTSDDKLVTADEGNASFTPVGWSGDTFVYQVRRNGYNDWQTKRESVKSFNASTGKLTTLDDTVAYGVDESDYMYETYGNTSLIDDVVLIAKNWVKYGGPILAGKHATITSIKPNGEDRKLLLEAGEGRTDRNWWVYSEYLSFEAKFYEPKEIYYSFYPDNVVYEYENGKVTQNKNYSTDSFRSAAYKTFLLSPSGKNVLWNEELDGKNTFIIGDENGENINEIATLKDYVSYGWYTDKYVLVSKNGSELYIMPVKGVKDEKDLLKVSDYHRPNQTFYGYGGGYGGL